MPSWTDTLRRQADLAAQRALGEQDAGPYSATTGCFDRRFWAWKLVDFPEATFQRLAFPLAMLYRDPRSRLHGQPEVLEAIRGGLACAARLQHPNGAFDQAFPFEQSYGATAFLLYPILETAALVDVELTGAERERVERTAKRAAAFLCDHDERHAVITNHLAGAALALVAAADRFGELRFETRAAALLDRVLGSQSAEGWFPEYGGADPGYQTLCVDYLAAVAERRPSPRLAEALDRAVDFLQWFVHPDGTLGGSYGSRRTSLVYLGGLARLAARNATAAAIIEATARAMAHDHTTSALTVDIGNLAPLLTSTVTALSYVTEPSAPAGTLPCDTVPARADFPEAGIHVRGLQGYYAVCGASNGGTLMVFSRATRALLVDDGGYVAALADGGLATTQATDRTRRARADATTIEIEAPFTRMSAALPTPARFLILRALNLTVMRSVGIGNWIKRRLVGLLIARGREIPMRLVRRISFAESDVLVQDRLENPTGLALAWMKCGTPFSSIHMASAGYFQAARLGASSAPLAVDVERLARERVVELRRLI